MNSRSNLLYLAIIVVVLITGGYFLLKSLKVGNDGIRNLLEKREATNRLIVWEGDLPAWGNPEAKIKLIEFGDFHCPFCALTVIEFYPQIEKYVEEGKIAFYFRDFPIAQLHPQAKLTHLASRCANEQGKYWEFHKEVFKDYYQRVMINRERDFSTGDRNYLLNLARRLNLDENKFGDCLDSEKYKAEIERDIRDGISLGVNGTPTFFINGEMVVGANFQSLMSKIEKLLR